MAITNPPRQERLLGFHPEAPEHEESSLSVREMRQDFHLCRLLCHSTA